MSNKNAGLAPDVAGWMEGILRRIGAAEAAAIAEGKDAVARGDTTYKSPVSYSSATGSLATKVTTPVAGGTLEMTAYSKTGQLKENPDAVAKAGMAKATLQLPDGATGKRERGWDPDNSKLIDKLEVGEIGFNVIKGRKEVDTALRLDLKEATERLREHAKSKPPAKSPEHDVWKKKALDLAGAITSIKEARAALPGLGEKELVALSKNLQMRALDPKDEKMQRLADGTTGSDMTVGGQNPLAKLVQGFMRSQYTNEVKPQANGGSRLTSDETQTTFFGGNLKVNQRAKDSLQNADGSGVSTGKTSQGSMGRTEKGAVGVGTSTEKETKVTDANGASTAVGTKTNSQVSAVGSSATGSGVKGAAGAEKKWSNDAAQGGPLELGKSTEKSVSASADGSYTCKIDTLGADLNPSTGRMEFQYRISLNLHVGTLAAGGARAIQGDREGLEDAKLIGGKTLRAALEQVGQKSGVIKLLLGADLTFSQVLFASEAEAYLGDVASVSRGTSPKTGYPEFGMWAQMKAAVLALEQGGKALAVVGAETAASLKPGQSVDIALTAGVEVGLSKSGLPLEAEAKGSVTGTRKATVEKFIDPKTKAECVRITLVFTVDRAFAASATYARLLAGGFAGDSEGASIAFALEVNSPSYAALFDEIKLLKTLEETAEFAANNGPLVYSRSWTARDNAGVQAGVKLVNANPKSDSLLDKAVQFVTSLTASEERTYSASTAATQGTVTGSRSGADSLQVDKLGGVTEAAEGSVLADGSANLDLRTTESVVDPLRAVVQEAGRHQGKGLGGVASVLGDVVTKGGVETAQEILFARFEDIKKINLSTPDLALLRERAKDAQRWSWACPSLKVAKDWEALRGALANPQPSGPWVEHDASPGLENSILIACIDAIVRLVKSHASLARDALQRALRHWGEKPGSGNIGSSADLGLAQEWPASLAKEQVKFDDLRAKVGKCSARFAEWEAKTPAKAAAQIRTYAESLLSGLADVRAKVEANRDITDERARAEMLSELLRLAAVVETELSKRGPAAPANQAPAHLQKRMEQLEAELSRLHGTESGLFKKARGLVRKELGGDIAQDTMLDNLTARFKEDLEEATRTMGRIAELYQQWVRVVLDLRAVYTEARVSARDWRVSRDAKAERNPNLEPRPEEWIQLHDQFTRHLPTRSRTEEELYAAVKKICSY